MSSNRRRTRDLLVGAVVFLAGLIFPCLIVWHLGPGHGARWVVNNPGACLFHIAILPVAVVLFLSAIEPTELEGLTTHQQWASFALLILFVTFASLMASCDAFAGPRLLAPYEFKDEKWARWAAEREGSLREQLSGDVSSSHIIVSLAESLGTPEDGLEQLTTVLRVHPWWEDLSLPGIYQVFLSTIGVVFAAVFLWYLIMMLVAQKGKSLDAWDEARYDRLILVSLITSLWFPLRLYSEWYIHFYSADISHYDPIKIATVVVTAVLVLLVVGREPGKPMKIFSLGNAAIVGILATLEKGNVLLRLAENYQKMAGIYFVASAIVLISVSLTLIFFLNPWKYAREETISWY